VGSVTTAHVQQDVDDAYNMGLDGLAVNIGCLLPFVNELLDAMNFYINNKYGNEFFFFISLDVYASGACSEGSGDFVPTILNYKDSTAYYKVNGAPFVSTYSSGGETNATWHTFLATAGVGSTLYFVPDFDDTDGYWGSSGGWWYYWGGVVNGLFSWESAWPEMGQVGDGSGGISRDEVIIEAAAAQDKTYMIRKFSLLHKQLLATDQFLSFKFDAVQECGSFPYPLYNRGFITHRP